MSSPESSESLGPVLVIGGCGFVGFHIVKHLLQASNSHPISVLSRYPNLNRCKGVSYHSGNIENLDEVRQILNDVKPRLIFHVAAPRASDPAIQPSDHFKTSVEGTKNMLACATESPFVKALVYTSTCAVAKGYQHFNIDETAPLWEQDSDTLPYFKSKALADTLVRKANSPLDVDGKGLLTVTLRINFVYGERDTQTIPAMLRTVEKGQTNIQLGNNKNLVDPTYVGNVATAHIQAAKKLLASEAGSLDLRVDGEAFHITEGDPQRFWTWARMIWRFAGDKTKLEDVTVIPRWLALSMARIIEWILFLFTFGRVRPPVQMSVLYIQYSMNTSTYDISKARTRLGYNPVIDKEAHLKRSIAWQFENQEENQNDLPAN